MRGVCANQTVSMRSSAITRERTYNTDGAESDVDTKQCRLRSRFEPGANSDLPRASSPTFPGEPDGRCQQNWKRHGVRPILHWSYHDEAENALGKSWISARMAQCKFEELFRCTDWDYQFLYSQIITMLGLKLCG